MMAKHYRTKLGDDIVTVRLNDEERRYLEVCKSHWNEDKDSTMLKKLAFSDIVLLDKLVRQ